MREKLKINSKEEITKRINNDLSYVNIKKDPQLWVKLMALRAINSGTTQVVVAQTYDVSRRSLNYWNKKYLTNGVDGLRMKPKRPCRFNDDVVKFIQELIITDTHSLGYNNSTWDGYMVKNELLKQLNLDVSYVTAIKWMKLSNVTQLRPKKS